MKDSKGGDLEFKLAIASTEQLLQEYGDKFDTIPLNKTGNIYIEKVGKDREKEPRFIATDQILGSVTTYDRTNVWDLDMNNTALQDKIFSNLITIKRRIDNEDTDDFGIDFEFEGKLIKVTYEPYTEDRSEYIIRELEERR